MVTWSIVGVALLWLGLLCGGALVAEGGHPGAAFPPLLFCPGLVLVVAAFCIRRAFRQRLALARAQEQRKPARIVTITPGRGVPWASPETSVVVVQLEFEDGYRMGFHMLAMRSIALHTLGKRGIALAADDLGVAIVKGGSLHEFVVLIPADGPGGPDVEGS